MLSPTFHPYHSINWYQNMHAQNIRMRFSKHILLLLLFILHLFPDVYHFGTPYQNEHHTVGQGLFLYVFQQISSPRM